MSSDTFRAAVSRPSLGAVVVTLAVAAAQLLFVGWLVTPEFVAANPPGDLMADPRDHDALVTHAAQTLRLGDVGELSVTLIGNSAFRESFSSAEDIAKALSKEIGRPVAVHDLTAGGVRVWDVGTLSDSVPVGYRGVVVMSTSAVADPALIRERHELPRFAIASDAFDDESRRAGLPPRPRTGIYVADFSGFFLPRASSMLRARLTAPVEPLRHMYLGRTMGAEYRKVMKTMLLARAHDYPKFRAEHYAAVGRNVDRLEGSKVVLIQPPLNRSVVEPVYGATLLEQMARDREELAREMGIEFWSLDDEAALADTDFFDYCHLNNHDAMVRYTRVLVEGLARVLNEVAEAHRG